MEKQRLPCQPNDVNERPLGCGAEALNVSTKDIQALILGGRGKPMVPMPRYTTIGGIPIRNLLSEDKVQEAIHRTQHGGEEIINHLGRSGWYAAGAAVC